MGFMTQIIRRPTRNEIEVAKLRELQRANELKEREVLALEKLAASPQGN